MRTALKITRQSGKARLKITRQSQKAGLCWSASFSEKESSHHHGTWRTRGSAGGRPREYAREDLGQTLRRPGGGQGRRRRRGRDRRAEGPLRHRRRTVGLDPQTRAAIWGYISA